MRLARIRLATIALLALCAPAADAQTDDVPPVVDPLRSQALADQPLFYLATNVALGMVSSTITAWIRDKPVKPAVLGGAMGGAVTWMGMRLLGTEQRALAFVGLQTSAVGASITRNAGNGIGLLDELTFTPFPLYITVRPRATESRVSVRVSAAALVAAASFLSASRWDLEPDWGETLAAGVLVLRSPRLWEPPTTGQPAGCSMDTICDGALLGRQWSGVLFYTAGQGPSVSRQILTHELVHVAQFSREAITYAVPASDAVLSLFGDPGRAVSRYLVLDWFTPVRFGNRVLGSIDDGSTYLELEADAMRGALGQCERAGHHC